MSHFSRFDLETETRRRVFILLVRVAAVVSADCDVKRKRIIMVFGAVLWSWRL